MDTNQLKHIHFIGIKGVGLTNLALLAKQRGIQITGSDVAEVFVTDSVLQESGIGWKTGFSADNLEGRPELVVVTAAHGGMTNPEAVAAKARGLTVVSYAEALGFFMQGKVGISVCGVGGKGSTSALLATVLTHAKLDPSYVIGVSRIQPLGYGAHAGGGAYFVAEADDYVACPLTDRTPKFMYQSPKIIIVTNIEYDHPDVYPDFSATKKAFLAFFRKLPPEGLLIANIDNPGVREVLREYSGKMATYGFLEAAQYRITDAQYSPGETCFTITGLGSFKLHIPGKYNVQNAAGALIAAAVSGVKTPLLQEGVALFRGIARRFELIGEANGISLVDDYAHHPQEIISLIAAVRSWLPDRRIVLIFQPHTFSRTRALFKEFAEALSGADLVILPKIYASAREPFDPEISSQKLAEALQSKNHPSYSRPEFPAVLSFLKENVKTGDVILTVGAGSVFQLHPKIMEILKGE